MPNAEWVGTPYARLYATLQDDHPKVWADDRLLAWYVRLLIPAERAFPVRLEWPRGLPADVELALVEDGALEAHGTRYQVHGLDRLRALNTPARLGGIARAAGAERGPDGRLLPAQPAQLDPAGHLNGEPPKPAGEAQLDNQPVQPPRPYTSRPDNRPTAGLSPKPPVPVPAPEAIQCDDYTGHRAAHQWWPSIGWRCSTCEAKRAAEEPSLKERIVDSGGHPF